MAAKVMDEPVASIDVAVATNEGNTVPPSIMSEEEKVSSKEEEVWENFVFLKNTKRRVPRAPKAPVVSWFGISRTGHKQNLGEELKDTEVVSPSPDRLEAYKYVVATTKSYIKNRDSPEAAQERRKAFEKLEGTKSPVL
jgi:hypothetical protein